MRRALLLLMALSTPLAGCASFAPIGSSWVDTAAESDSGQLSEIIVVFVAQSLPPGTPVELIAPPDSQARNLLTLQIQEQLAARGYLADGKTGERRHRVRYQVSKWRDRLLLRINLDAVEASVLFARDQAGRLKAGPLSIRR